MGGGRGQLNTKNDGPPVGVQRVYVRAGGLKEKKAQKTGGY